MATPTERLPWSNDAPSGGSPTVQKRRGGAMWPWYLLLLLLIAAVASGAWWLHTGKEAAAPVLPTENSLPIPATSQEQPASEPLTIDENAVSAASLIEPPPPPVTRPARAPEARTSERRIQQRPERSRTTASPNRGVFPADDPTEGALPTTGPAPAVVGNPNPNRGRVVQLGAFPTRVQAEDSWKRITRRYPYLATKSKMVNTVDVRGLGGGRPTRMYRLQLGTSSQAQSVVICQQLERAGHSCVVVY